MCVEKESEAYYIGGPENRACVDLRKGYTGEQYLQSLVQTSVKTGYNPGTDVKK